MEDKKETNFGEDMKEEGLPWDKDDDRYLKTLVSIHGIHDWSTISSNMNFTFPAKHRTSEDCKQRWYEHLDPSISKQPWSDQEELEMLIAHQKHQNKWSDVAQALSGRSNNTIKNRFYSIFRKVKNKIKRREFTYNSKLELLEIFYMISLMEHYLTHPQPLTEQKGKRGKDFIYSLLRSLKLEDVEKYKMDLQKQGGREIVLEELWLELASKGQSLGTSKPHPPAQEARPVEAMSIDFIGYISEPPSAGRHPCVLPQPHNMVHPVEALTPDEKDFIQTQAFQGREPCSAGTFYGQPMVMSPPAFRTAPFSAGRPLIQAARLEAFSDYTDGVTQPQPHFVQPRMRAPQGLGGLGPFSAGFGGAMRVIPPLPGQDKAPPIYAPLPIFGRPPCPINPLYQS